MVGRGLTVGLGIAVGLTGCFVTFFTEWIVHAKLHFIAHIIEEYEGESGEFCRAIQQNGWRKEPLILREYASDFRDVVSKGIGVSRAGLWAES